MSRVVTRTVARPYHAPPTRPRTKGRWVLVYCPICERYISQEYRHPCEQPPELRARRLEERKVKQMETGIRDYD